MIVLHFTLFIDSLRVMHASSIKNHALQFFVPIVHVSELKEERSLWRHTRRKTEETNVGLAGSLSLHLQHLQKLKSNGLGLLKHLLSDWRPQLPLYLNKPIHGKLDDPYAKLPHNLLSYLHSILFYIQKTGYPVDYLKVRIDELFSLCSEYLDIMSKSSKDFRKMAYAKRSNIMKKMVAQFQTTDRFNDLPRDLVIDILARVLLEVVEAKIIASLDNIIA